MSLDGLRAWIGEVERKLGMRTRIFLVLAAIAIGGAGAAVYLALDASDEATGEADVSALEARIDQLESQASGEADVAPLELQVDELQKRVEQLEAKGGSVPGGASSTGGVGAAGAANGVETVPGGAAPAPGKDSLGLEPK